MRLHIFRQNGGQAWHILADIWLQRSFSCTRFSCTRFSCSRVSEKIRKLPARGACESMSRQLGCSPMFAASSFRRPRHRLQLVHFAVAKCRMSRPKCRHRNHRLQPGQVVNPYSSRCPARYWWRKPPCADRESIARKRSSSCPEGRLLPQQAVHPD